MNIFRTAKLSVRGMLANKLRAMLSSLGIIIGVFSVVVLLAIGEGAQKSILSNIEALGTNLLTVSPGGQNQGNVRSAGGSNRNIFTMDHADLIATLSGVAAVAPTLQTSGQVVFGSQNTSSTIYGVTSDYQTVRNTKAEKGSFITAKNEKNREKVAVIGPTIVTNLFGSTDPIGQTIRIGNTLFTVVGVTESKGSGMGGNQDSAIYVPLSTAIISLIGSPYLASISVSVEDTEQMETVKSLIETTLMESLGTTSDDMKFTVQSQEDMLETASSITDILKGFLTGIAAISLIVGGIGVMNILLVTVTERTKEIGIRKAIGAKDWDIVEQFLVESVMLTLFGGVVAIVLSYGVVKLVNIMIASLSATITLGHIVLAISFSFGVGLFFGIFPAYKAAKMKPIDALRTE